jgi:aspartyl-tRNA(Asn)/glutamyl-tRNA(Gln) amidotransferase subunit A
MGFRNISEKVNAIKSGEYSAFSNVKSFGEKINSSEIKEMNILLNINNNALEQAKEIDERIKNGKEVGKLAGICFVVKACISVKNMETNCASKVLEGYVSPYNASVINK